MPTSASSPEVGRTVIQAGWSELRYPGAWRTVRSGSAATRRFLREHLRVAGLEPRPVKKAASALRLPWYSPFGDSTLPHRHSGCSFADRRLHAIAAARIAADRAGLHVVGWAQLRRENLPRDVLRGRLPANLGLEAPVTDDYHGP